MFASVEDLSPRWGMETVSLRRDFNSSLPPEMHANALHSAFRAVLQALGWSDVGITATFTPPTSAISWSLPRYLAPERPATLLNRAIGTAVSSSVQPTGPLLTATQQDGLSLLRRVTPTILCHGCMVHNGLFKRKLEMADSPSH